MPKIIPNISDWHKENFFSKIKKKEENDCWLWTGAKMPNGYGEVSINSKTYGTHIVAFYLNIGVWPNGYLIRHSCNNRLCCNYKHLLDGSYADNNKDTRDNGNWKSITQIGSDNYLTDLTENDIKEIRWLANFITQKELGNKYNLSESSIYSIVNHLTWKHVI